jgi:hypothetical protein
VLVRGALRALLFNQSARGAGSRQWLSPASDVVKRRVLKQTELFADCELLSAQIGGVAVVPSGMIAKLDDRIRRALMSLASAMTPWCFTAANRVMTVSAEQGPQTATCQRTGPSSSGQPTTASGGPPPQNVQVSTRSPPTTFHWRWVDRGERGREIAWPLAIGHGSLERLPDHNIETVRR